eukprot:m.102049 g.102049  ORF g.102049 m.102049 type:complete len:54 (+) comp37152_c0_seq16:133-294(+)
MPRCFSHVEVNINDLSQSRQTAASFYYICCCYAFLRDGQPESRHPTTQVLYVE